MTRVAALLVVAIALSLAPAAPARAGIVAPEDAAELAQTLAEAQEDQDVCYGWNVSNNFSSSSDVGSSIGGPGVALVPTQSACPKGAVILEGDIDYSCDSCESSDSASVSISSNLANPPTVGDLKGLGLEAGALTGDDDDTTLVNMVNALPLLVADRGNAPYVAYEQATTVPAADHATDKPGSDLLRDSWLGLLFFGGLTLAGPGFYFYKRAQTPRRRRKRSSPGTRREPDYGPDASAAPADPYASDPAASAPDPGAPPHDDASAPPPGAGRPSEPPPPGPSPPAT